MTLCKEDLVRIVLRSREKDVERLCRMSAILGSSIRLIGFATAQTLRIGTLEATIFADSFGKCQLMCS